MVSEHHELDISWPIRCYNGAFDSRTQRILDNQKKVLLQIKAKEPGLSITYFPVEERYGVFLHYREIARETTYARALRAATRLVTQR